MRKHFFLIALALCVQVWAATVTAPANLPQYYSTYINNKSASTLFTGVHDVAGVGFSSISYSAVWDAYEVTDTKSNGTSIYDFYSYCSDFTYPNSQEGKSGANSKEGDCYNREHSIPKSWFGGSTSTGTPGTDLFHLVPADKIINSLRSAHAYGEVTAANATSTSKTGCGNNANPLHNYCRYGTASAITISNTIISSGSTTQSPTVTVFEPLQEYKGDLARGYFGTLLKWAGDYDAFTTGDGAQMFSGDYTAAGNFGLTPYGIALLLKWHREDPVSQKEIDRNNGVQQKQGNRNPFIDYPILAEYIWGKYAGETFSQENAVGSFESGFTPGVSDGDKNGSTPATYTVTWFVEGTQYAQQSTLPADPNDCSASRVFVGWTTNSSVNGSAPEDLFTTTPPAITANTTFYAVFADVSSTSSGSSETSFAPTDFSEQGTSGTGSDISATKNGVTFACNKGYGGSETRCYKNGVITISSSNPITALAFTFSGSYTADLQTSYSDLNTTSWTYTLPSQARFSSITVTTSGSTSYSNYGLLCEDCTPEEPNASFASSTQSTTCGGAVVNALNKGGSAGLVTYTSSDTDVATVNANSGAVTIEKVGTTVITAYIGAAGCYTATSAAYTLTVNAKEAATAFSNLTTSLEESESALNAATTNSDGTIVYASNNTAVATVNTSTGVVTAVKPGTARITASVAATDCYAASSAYYDLTVTAIPTYTITWKANGVTVQTDNVKRDALYSLPDDPSDCSVNRVFKGWTIEKNYENATTAPGDLFISAFAAPILTQDTTIYAVYADKQTTSLPITVTDSLTRAFTGVTGTSYTTWADKAGTSGVVYAGNSAGGNSAIQMRSDQSSAGIITTTSPGTIKNVTLVWNSNTNNTRVVNVYGKNTPYSSAADLYSTETQGTLLGSMKMSTDKTSLDISATYAYVGIRSNSGALYLDSVLFTWNVPGGATETTYINYSPRCNEEYDFRALAATEVTHNSFMANWTEAAGDSYTLDVTKDVKKQQETVVFDKDFTASLDGWTINNVSGYDNVWTHSTSYGAKATSYVNSTKNAAESWLLSSNIDLTNVVNPVLTLNHLFRYGTSVYLKIKEQSSESWDELSPTNWAAGSDWTFVNSVADLSSYAGKIIQIGFKYVGTSSACPTWEIKQITITGTTEVNDLESIDGYPRKVYDTSALVSGLDAKTTYYYTVTPENGIVSNRIEVTTLENEEPTNMENVFPALDVRKLLINGQIFILREGFLYTLTGQRIR